MSVTAPERPAGSYTSLGPTRSTAVSRLRSVVPWIVILLLGALALVAVGVGSTGEGRLLDPRDPSPVGSQALAEVLRSQGVDVRPMTSLAQLPSEIPSGTTVVVTADDRLSPNGLREVMARSVTADRLVVLLTAPEAVAELVPGLQGYPLPTQVTVRSAPGSGCEIPGVRPGDTVAGGTVDLTWTDDPTAEAVLCLPPRETGGSAMLGHLPAQPGTAETFLVGFARGLTNEHIPLEDNAAVALRLLGPSPELVWLIPSGIDGPDAASGDSTSPWPAWSTPVATVLALGTVLLALVRGRRLGRLVPEPLPVTVRAAETTESRGHLYQRSRDRARTAAILREATRRRLRRRLAVARTAPLDTLVTATATATGEPRDRIQTLLTDAEPKGARDLVQLGTDLADLERKVRLT